MNINEALVKIHDLISPVTTDWMLIGTMSLFLQGYAVNPHDVDILCSAAEVEKIGMALSDYFVQPDGVVSRDKFRSAFSRYNVKGIDVELMGDLEVNTPQGWVKLLDSITQTEQVNYAGRLFTVPSKADQLKNYLLFGREKDDAIIRMLIA